MHTQPSGQPAPQRIHVDGESHHFCIDEREVSLRRWTQDQTDLCFASVRGLVRITLSNEELELLAVLLETFAVHPLQSPGTSTAQAR